MTETAHDYSPLAPAISPRPPNDRRRARAAGCYSRRLSPTANDWAPGTPANHQGVFAFDLANDGCR
jgi:hypothetical protein